MKVECGCEICEEGRNKLREVRGVEGLEGCAVVSEDRAGADGGDDRDDQRGVRTRGGVEGEVSFE